MQGGRRQACRLWTSRRGWRWTDHLPWAGRNTRIPGPRSLNERILRETSGHLGLWGHLVRPPGRLPALLGRGQEEAVRADKGLATLKELGAISPKMAVLDPAEKLDSFGLSELFYQMIEMC